VITPNIGLIYTGGKKKAEHGGFAPDDTHVALLVVDGARGRDGEDDDRIRGAAEHARARTVAEAVRTTQVAPTILAYLGLDPEQLRSVRLEGTAPLPDPRD